MWNRAERATGSLLFFLLLPTSPACAQDAHLARVHAAQGDDGSWQVSVEAATVIDNEPRTLRAFARATSKPNFDAYGCLEEWEEVRLFVGSNVASDGSGAEWASYDVELDICRLHDGRTLKLKGTPHRDASSWGKVRWNGGVELATTTDASVAATAPVVPARVWPDRIEWDRGQAQPQGYVYKERRRWELAAAGAGLFTASYLAAPAIAVPHGYTKSEGLLFVPLVGPLLYLAREKSGSQSSHDAGALVPVLALLPTLGQVAGLTLIGVGAATKRKWWQRVVQPEGMQLSYLSTRGGGVMFVSGAF